MDSMDLIYHIYQQREWSEQTFGPGHRTNAVLDHIRKELSEIEAEPQDLEEWVDLVLLGLDGAWRAGFSPEQIAAEIAAKLIRNKNRTWPDWRNSDPDKAIEHVRDFRSCCGCGIDVDKIPGRPVPPGPPTVPPYCCGKDECRVEMARIHRSLGGVA